MFLTLLNNCLSLGAVRVTLISMAKCLVKCGFRQQFISGRSRYDNEMNMHVDESYYLLFHLSITFACNFKLAPSFSHTNNDITCFFIVDEPVQPDTDSDDLVSLLPDHTTLED